LRSFAGVARPQIGRATPLVLHRHEAVFTGLPGFDRVVLRRDFD
jgi:hypothetical protein